MLTRPQNDDANEPGRRGRRRVSVDHLALRPAAPALGQTLQDAVYQQLRNAVIVGSFSPGEALSARAIADSLGTSGTPVKDALRRLVAERVLQALPQSSFVVETLTARRFLDLIEARVKLETMVAAKAAENSSRALIRTLSGLNERYRAAHRASLMRGELLQANFDFHFTIYEAARMPDVCEVILAVWLRTGALFSLIEPDLDQDEDYRKHARIIDALASRDPAATAVALEADIRTSAQRIVSKLPS